jgi:hypothetical protein
MSILGSHCPDVLGIWYRFRLMNRRSRVRIPDRVSEIRNFNIAVILLLHDQSCILILLIAKSTYINA